MEPEKFFEAKVCLSVSLAQEGPRLQRTALFVFYPTDQRHLSSLSFYLSSNASRTLTLTGPQRQSPRFRLRAQSGSASTGTVSLSPLLTKILTTTKIQSPPLPTSLPPSRRPASLCLASSLVTSSAFLLSPRLRLLPLS